MKTAISLPDELFHRAEDHARRLGVSRSEFYARAARRYADELDDDGLTAAVDAAIDTGADTNAASPVAPQNGRSPGMSSIRRGDVYWADLGPARGSSPAFRRPVIVVQSDRYNDSRLRTVIVVSLTTSRQAAQMPGNVFVPAELSGLPDDSVANITQISTLDRDDIAERAGSVPAWLLDDLDDSVRRVLAR